MLQGLNYSDVYKYIALHKYKEWQSAVSVGEVSSLIRTRSSRPHLRWTSPGLP